MRANRVVDLNYGIWIQRDPSGESGGLNTTEEMDDDPINQQDQNGLAAGEDDNTEEVRDVSPSGRLLTPREEAENGRKSEEELEREEDAREALRSETPEEIEGTLPSPRLSDVGRNVGPDASAAAR